LRLPLIKFDQTICLKLRTRAIANLSIFNLI
jgi:hypothetical protein